MRQTSIDVYRQIEAEGLLSRVDFTVYDVLFSKGPLTQGEAWKQYIDPVYMRHTVGPAFARLKRSGAIKEVDTRMCKVTGRKCLSWDVTNNLPVKIKREKIIPKSVQKERERCALLAERMGYQSLGSEIRKGESSEF